MKMPKVKCLVQSYDSETIGFFLNNAMRVRFTWGIVELSLGLVLNYLRFKDGLLPSSRRRKEHYANVMCDLHITGSTPIWFMSKYADELIAFNNLLPRRHMRTHWLILSHWHKVFTGNQWELKNCKPTFDKRFSSICRNMTGKGNVRIYNTLYRTCSGTR